MKQKFFLLCCVFLFCACEGEVDTNIVTSGTNYTEEKHKAMLNIDANSYAEVADVFLDTSIIKSDGLPYLLVFSANGCVYCDRLKEMIKINQDVKIFLKEHYAPYYINISYSKMHEVEFLKDKVETTELAQKYGIKPTPTLVFLSPNGKELLAYTGFMPKDKFLKTLEFFNNENLENMESKEIKEKWQEYLL